MRYPHHHQILPLKNQVLPVDRDTTALLPMRDDLVNRITGEPVLRWEHCLDFNGTSDSVVVPIGSRLEGKTQVTFEYIAELTSQTGNVLYKDDCILVENEGTHHRIRLHLNSGWQTNAYISAGSFQSGLNHITVTYDANQGTNVYLNAKHYEAFPDEISGELNTSNADRDLEIGQRNGTEWYNGRIQMVRIWDTCLPLSMIQQWLHREAPNTPNLVGQWILNTDTPIIGDTTGTHDGLRDGCTLVRGDLVYSHRRLEGKFGNAIAVEPATYNYCRNGDFTEGEDGMYGWYTNTGDGSSHSQGYDPELGPYMHFDWQSGGLSYHWLRMLSDIGRGYAESGSTYTMSCWVRVHKIYDAYIHIDHGAYQNDQSSSLRYKKVDGNWDDGQWHKIEFTRTFEESYENGNEPLDAHFSIHSGRMTDNPDCYIAFDLTRIQIEQSDQASGFVHDERPNPRVEAPSTWINPTQGAIGCWVYLSMGNGWTPVVSFIPNNSDHAIDSHDDLHFDVYQSDSYRRVRLKASNKDTNENVNIEGVLVDGWNYVACSWGPDGLMVYGNGEHQWDTSYTGGIAEVHPEIAIGHQLYSSKNILSGAIQELRIDRVQRTERDFAAWHASNAPFGGYTEKGG